MKKFLVMVIIIACLTPAIALAGPEDVPEPLASKKMWSLNLFYVCTQDDCAYSRELSSFPPRVGNQCWVEYVELIKDPFGPEVPELRYEKFPCPWNVRQPVDVMSIRRR